MSFEGSKKHSMDCLRALAKCVAIIVACLYVCISYPCHCVVAQVRHLKGSHRIEVHVYAPELITLVAECSGEETEDQETGIEPDSLTTMATQLLIMISKHVQTLASDWFSGIYNIYCNAAT